MTGGTSHKNHQSLSYLILIPNLLRIYTNFKKECNSILVPPLCKGGRRVLHDFRKMVLLKYQYT